ncbi:PREDICTED: sodium-dependent noradrenaline transporter-like isoform X1 [Nicrophorus vespilloides]|uniref:Transporter n=3 Tax=Nicrophorus vespilloides TaxID=110193 RepID=A0ABM1N4G7_NICVS|nr:PREDICTED: sodium-dependent noradrenaline transporter-like isoform X1 [Nicrophorus vespilloides]XP_017781717.1 PREDICTED: sodium-dependent noradrenaline transporter-like isoform X1 [Nicrophorus vespilloides]
MSTGGSGGGGGGGIGGGGLYENLQLTFSGRPVEVRQFLQSDARKRKSTSEVSGMSHIKSKTASRSVSDLKLEDEAGGDQKEVVAEDSMLKDDSSGSVETLLAEDGKAAKMLFADENEKVPKQYSATGLDDGYESCNSTPHGSGSKTNKHLNVITTLLPAYMFRKKELHVQLENRKFESFALSASSSQVEVDPQSPKDPGDNRETWSSNLDFLLSIIGFAVDLANVWRFPYLCYRNGGGAFLIPYTLMMIFGAVPLFYMELILGQYNRQGPISVWRICPLFKGVGFCAVLVAFYVSFYYNVIIAWALYFLGSSFSSELPWLHCNNTWNSDMCWDNVTKLTVNESEMTNRHSPASEFFHRKVLEMQFSDGLHDIGYPKWQLVVCLVVVYTMLYISLFKGVKSSGKVVWITATMPYVVLTILLIRGLMLPGALKGISYYLKPEMSKLKETQVWVDAAVQIFFSVGAGFGVHLSYASYNTFHNNCYRDCIVTTAVNCFTSFFSGFVIFTYLGYMSHKHNVHISTVATEGPGLVFQVYPEAVATLPGSHIWSMLFFFMLIMLGLDSAMGGLECVITGIMDEFEPLFKKCKLSREVFTLIVIILSFSVATINVTPGGIYLFHLLDTYAAGISLLCSALFEAIAVSWCYGLDRFTQDVESMIGIKPGLYWRVCWKFISPLFIIGVVIFGLLYPQPLQYNDYFYPSWANYIGWFLALSSILMIPIVAVIQILKTKGSFMERLAINISPMEEHTAIREEKKISRFRAKHWLYV